MSLLVFTNRMSPYPVGERCQTALVRMTCATDAKEEVTYYEYDGFQRLANIRDIDGNIIKHFDYHYQGQ